MPVYEYKCSKCGAVIEKIVSISMRETPHLCERDECDGESYPIMSASHFSLEGITGDFPGAAMKWDKRHQTKT